MSRLFLGLCFCLITSSVTNAQEIKLSEEIVTYLESNGTMEQYQYAYQQLLNMLGEQYPKTEQNGAGWNYLENNREKSLTEILSRLVPIYEKHFGKEEISKMTQFYKSETGKQLIADRSGLSDLQQEEMNTFYNSEVGQKIIDKQTILTQEISKASEDWSRELYEMALSLLKND